MKSLAKCFCILAFCFAPCTVLAFGNEDVLKLIEAKFDEGMVLQAISSASPVTFDTSAEGLIGLKKAGVSDTIIQKILARQREGQMRPANQAGYPFQMPPSGDECVFEVTGMENKTPVRADGKITPLDYKVGKREAAAGNMLGSLLTLGLVKTRATASLRINGDKAEVRIHERTPEFLNVIFPLGASPDEYLLVRMTVEGNSRVVQVGSGEVGVTGTTNRANDFGENVRAPVVAEKVTNQCTWRGKQWAVYRMKPAAPLEPGEYGIIVGNGKLIYDFAVE